MDRAEKGILLRDSEADNCDSWYMQRGSSPVYVECRNTLNHLKFTKSEQLFLDAGCGTGRLTLQISQEFPNLKLEALDISTKSLKVLESKDANNSEAKQFVFFPQKN